MAAKREFTVSGPDVDVSYPEGAVALSAAITYAGKARDEATFYVRYPGGDGYGRVERDAGGALAIYRTGEARR